MGIMFQTAAPQMQQIAPVHHHHHPAASVAGLGIGATLPTASFASNMVVGPLGSFAQPTAASLGQNPVMATPQPFTSSQSIANSTAATIQGMRTIAEILPTAAVSVAGPSGQTMTQFQYSAPQTTQAQLQEASESMLAMTMAGAPSTILHTQATAETMAAAAAAVAAATASSNPGPANGTPIARFHPSGVQPHSALQRHGINNQTPSYNHLPYYYTQR
ncbi:hypothetical protein GGI23_000481 [Coemansia sp. RSA 2559]|nr:hypothetical protein GGI23_000481 [Coemansia sp. RSA 2559]